MYTAPLKTAFLLLTLGISTITGAPTPVEKRALVAQTYNEFQVSSGVGGKALEEVNAKFPIGTDFAAVSAADLAIISKAAQVAENAEVGAGGFNDAIDAAGGTKTAAGAALQVGKIKNKVLKLQTDVLRLQIQVAQGKTDKQAQLDGQIVKLNKNVATDRANAGKASTPVDFAG